MKVCQYPYLLSTNGNLSITIDTFHLLSSAKCENRIREGRSPKASSKANFEENIAKFKKTRADKRLPEQSGSKNPIKKYSSLKGNQRLNKIDLGRYFAWPLVTQYQPSVPNIIQALIKTWHLIQN